MSSRLGWVSGPTWTFAALAAVCWLIVLLAGVALVFGNPGAINPLVGVPFPGALATWAAVALYRQDRRWRP